MDLTFYVFFLVSAAIGMGSSFIGDIFFIFSYKNYEILLHELRILQRLQFTSIVAASIALGARVLYVSELFDQQVPIYIGVECCIVLILGLIIITNMVLRKFHLPALIRHQQRHSHLSEGFKDHHDALISSSAFSLISWLSIICIAAVETRGALGSIGFLHIFFGYAITSFLFIQFAQKIKGFYQIS